MCVTSIFPIFCWTMRLWLVERKYCSHYVLSVAGSLQFHCRRLHMFLDSMKQRSAMRCTVLLTWHRYSSRFHYGYSLGSQIPLSKEKNLCFIVCMIWSSSSSYAPQALSIKGVACASKHDPHCIYFQKRVHPPTWTIKYNPAIPQEQRRHTRNHFQKAMENKAALLYCDDWR